MVLQTKLADIQTLPSTPSSVYANPASTTTYIRLFILHNTNSSSQTVKIYNVPDTSGALGGASTLNRFANLTMAANETVFISFEQPITLTDTNDAIFAESSNSASVTLMIHGAKE